MGFRSSYNKFKASKPLTRKEAMEAQCFECNGLTAELKDDCLGASSCPLYSFSPWGRAKKVSSGEGLERAKTHRIDDPTECRES